MVLVIHYDDVIMGAIASQITSLASVYSIVYSGTDQRKHQNSASLAFVGPVTWKMFPFDDVIMHVYITKIISCWTSVLKRHLQRHLLLFLAWWRHQMETFSALLADCEGNHRSSVDSPSQTPVTWSFDVVFDLRLNKWLRKQSRRRLLPSPAILPFST